MHPILFQFEGITLRWYGLFAAIGFFAAWTLFRKRASLARLNEEEASSLMMLLFVSGILGSRIFYVIRNWSAEFAHRPLEIVMIHHGGLVFYGGLVAGVMALIIWCRMKKKSFPEIADTLAASLALGHAFGRLGCFMNGCCYGMACTQSWAIRPNAPPQVAGLALHPVQLYEAAGLFYLAFSLVIVQRISRYPGQTALTYGLLYALLRFITEFFRGDVSHDVFGRLTIAQALCIPIFLGSWLVSSRLAWNAARVRRIKAVEGMYAAKAQGKNEGSWKAG